MILLFFVVAFMERTLQKQSISFEESLEKGTQIIKELRKEEDTNLKICIDGICTVAIDQYINSKEGLEFLLFAKDGTKLEVERISYGKIGR